MSKGPHQPTPAETETCQAVARTILAMLDELDAPSQGFVLSMCTAEWLRGFHSLLGDDATLEAQRELLTAHMAAVVRLLMGTSGEVLGRG